MKSKGISAEGFQLAVTRDKGGQSRAREWEKRSSGDTRRGKILENVINPLRNGNLILKAKHNYSEL